MKHANFIIKNIEKWIDTDISLLDLFFVSQNLTTDPRTRYSDFIDLRKFHLRADYWQYNIDTDLPLLTYSVEDYFDGIYDKCRKDLVVVFRYTVRSQIHDAPISPEIVDIVDPLESAGKLFTIIKCKFEKSPTLFEMNECQPEEAVDCNGVTTIQTFPYNLRGAVSGQIRNTELPQNTSEVIQYELRIPYSVYKLYTNCPCEEFTEDC